MVGEGSFTYWCWFPSSRVCRFNLSVDTMLVYGRKINHIFISALETSVTNPVEKSLVWHTLKAYTRNRTSRTHCKLRGRTTGMPVLSLIRSSNCTNPSTHPVDLVRGPSNPRQPGPPPGKLSKKESVMTTTELQQWRRKQESKYRGRSLQKRTALVNISLALSRGDYTYTRGM